MLTTTTEKLQRELTPQEKQFLKWVHVKHLRELEQDKLKK